MHFADHSDDVLTAKNQCQKDNALQQKRQILIVHHILYK